MLLSWWNWSVWWGYFCHVWVDRLKIERGFIVYNQAGDGWIEVQKIATQRRFQMVVKGSSVRRNATHCFELNGDWFKFVRAWVHAKQLCAVLKSLYVMLCKRCYLLLVCQIATDTNSQHVSNGRCQCNNVGRSDKTKDRERGSEKKYRLYEIVISWTRNVWGQSVTNRVPKIPNDWPLFGYVTVIELSKRKYFDWKK